MNDAAIMTDSHEIVVDEVFPHAPEAVWKTLTTPESMGRWLMMMPTGLEPTKGKRFTYQTTPSGAWDGVIHCLVLDAIPNERLVYEWRGGHDANAGYGSRLETVITWTLSKVGGGTRLRLVHSGFRTPKNDFAFKNMSQGWPTVFQRIDTIAGKHEKEESHMVDILHKVGIKSSSLDDAYKALTTREGLSAWWTHDTQGESKVGGVLLFRFGAGGFDMKVLELHPAKRVLWQAVDGPQEWIGTKISFELKQEGNWTIILFKHEGWKEPVEFMHHCSTKWAVFLLSLKSLLETGRGAPHPHDIKLDSWE